MGQLVDRDLIPDSEKEEEEMLLLAKDESLEAYVGEAFETVYDATELNQVLHFDQSAGGETLQSNASSSRSFDVVSETPVRSSPSLSAIRHVTQVPSKRSLGLDTSNVEATDAQAAAALNARSTFDELQLNGMAMKSTD